MTSTLAERVHAANLAATKADADLWEAIVKACGPLDLDDDDIRTDYYDNSIEIWSVGDIDLDASATKLKSHGFAKVWLHQHHRRTNCECPCR